MHIAFRTDASLDIGTGHVMRCLTLADALRERGVASRFICRAHPGNLIDTIRQRGYEVQSLALNNAPASADAEMADALPVHAAWLGSDWVTDAQETIAALGETIVDWLVVDHYALDAHWERSVQPFCRNLMVIDDLADRLHDADLLLDQNLGRNAADYSELAPIGCKMLVGPRYALLRPEFSVLRADSLAHREKSGFKKILIAMGGVDKDNATARILDALRDGCLPAECSLTVVMGPHAPWLAQVKEKAAAMPWRTEVQVNIHNMAQLMADSDFAIGAAGTTAWERCCLGLPTATLILAKNQAQGAIALEAAGAVLLLRSLSNLEEELPALMRKLTQADILREMNQSCSAITDGRGATRVVSELINASV